MKPIFDRDAFAEDVGAWLERHGLSYHDACARFPLLNRALLSRAINSHVLSIESMLAICEAAKLNPLVYTRLRAKQKQAVTAIDKRETLVGAA